MWVTVFFSWARERKNILSSGLNTFPNERRCILSPRAQACLRGITDWLIMRCWAIRTAQSHRDWKSAAWGWNSCCSSARGVKLQRSPFRGLQSGKATSIWEETKREIGRRRREGMRQRWGPLFSHLLQLHCPFSYQCRKNGFTSPSRWWCLIAGCQVRLQQPDGAAQLEPNSWWRLGCIIEAADDSPVAPIFTSRPRLWLIYLPSLCQLFGRCVKI